MCLNPPNTNTALILFRLRCLGFRECKPLPKENNSTLTDRHYQSNQSELPEFEKETDNINWDDEMKSVQNYPSYTMEGRIAEQAG